MKDEQVVLSKWEMILQGKQGMSHRFQLNKRKCKELCITFRSNEPEFDPVCVNPSKPRDCQQCEIVRI